MTRDDVIRLAKEACVAGSQRHYQSQPDDGPRFILTVDVLERFAALVIKAHTQQVITDPAEIRRVFEIDEADYPPPDSGFAKLEAL